MPEYKKREAEIYRLRSKYEDANDGYDFARYQLRAEKKAADKRVAERIKPFLMNNSVRELDYNSHTGERKFKHKFITDRSVVLTDKESLQKYSDWLPKGKKAEFKALVRKATEEERAKERELEKQVKQIEAKARPYYKKYKATPWDMA